MAFFVSLYLFLNFSVPYLLNQSSLRAAADSPAYLLLLENEPKSLIDATSNFLGPFVLVNLFRENLIFYFFFNFLISSIGILLITKYYFKSVKDKIILSFLLIFSPLMLISLPVVNKEILGFFGICFLILYLKKQRGFFLLLCLAFSIATRWQQFLTVVIFLFLNYSIAKVNNKNKNVFALIIILFSMSILYRIVPQQEFAVFEDQAISANTVITLNEFQKNGFYWLVYLPKLFLNLFGNPINGFIYLISFSENLDLYRLFGILQEFLMLIIFSLLIFKKKIIIQGSLFLFAGIYSILYSFSPFIQSRYFFPIYPVFLIMLFYDPEARTGIKKYKKRGEK
jgi:hypothetical protein